MTLTAPPEKPSDDGAEELARRALAVIESRRHTLDVYTHVLISPEEVSEEAYRAALVVSPWCLD